MLSIIETNVRLNTKLDDAHLQQHSQLGTPLFAGFAPLPGTPCANATHCEKKDRLRHHDAVQDYRRFCDRLSAARGWARFSVPSSDICLGADDLDILLEKQRRERRRRHLVGEQGVNFRGVTQGHRCRCGKLGVIGGDKNLP